MTVCGQSNALVCIAAAAVYFGPSKVMHLNESLQQTDNIAKDCLYVWALQPKELLTDP